MHHSSRVPGMGNQDNTDHGPVADGALNPDELAALLDGLRGQVAIVDRAGRPRKLAAHGPDPIPTEDDAVPDEDRESLHRAIQACADDGLAREAGFRRRQHRYARRFHVSLRAAGDNKVLLAWQEWTPGRATVRALGSRYEMEELLGRLADAFINVAPEGIDAAIDAALGEAARQCGADLAHVYQLTEEHDHLRNTHAWRRQGVIGGPGPHRRLPRRAVPWIMHRLRRGTALRIDELDKLPAEAARERALFAQRQLQSLLLVPLIHSGELRGLVSFETVENRVAWLPDAVYLAKRVGELLAGALQRKHSEQRIFRLAYYDQLTGLPNRLLLRSRLDTLLRLRRRPFGLVLIDLDDASTLNDLMGHDVGDLLLRTLSDRLQRFTGTGEILARWGGDAFMLTIPLEDDDTMPATERLGAIRQALAAPVRIDGHQLRVSSCMGMASHPRHTSEVDEMIRFAEIALNQAKHQGRDSVVVFDSEMEHRVARRNRIERRLREAVEKQAFDLHYQPQVCSHSGELVGAEALIRWYDEELGQVPPDRFIDLAEETGLILPIGEWLVRRACADLARWQACGFQVPTVAINVAGPQLMDDQLPAVLERELERHGLAASALELEITESALMHRQEPSLRLLRRLRELGIGIAVDDFGTGYSSLSQIKHLPVSKLKIDRSFIQDIFSDADDRAIVTAIIAMGHQLGLRVVAEGVETRDQLVFLRDQRCDMVQGHIHGRAAAPTTFMRRMQASSEHRQRLA